MRELGEYLGAATTSARWLARLSLRLWRRLPLRARFLLAFGLILTGAFSAMVWQLGAQYQREDHNQASTVCQEETTEYTLALQHRLGDRPISAFTADWLAYRHLDAGESMTISVTAPSRLAANGRAVVMSAGDKPSVREVRSAPHVSRWLAAPPRAPMWATEVLANGHQLRMLVTPIRLHGALVGAVIASVDLAERNWTKQLVMVAVGEAAGALAAALLVAHILLRRTLSVIARLRDAALQTGPAGLSHRVSYEGPVNDAAGELAHAFNIMLERLEAAFTAQQQLLADVSHQLRTPLAVTRGHLELAADTAEPQATGEAVAIAIDQIDHMRLLVDRLMILGRAIEPGFLDRRPFPVRPLLTEVLDAARVLAAREWLLGPVSDVVIDGDKNKIRGALLNLVDNAAKASREGSRIVLSARMGDGCVLEVADEGHGIASADIGRVFDRFARPGARYSQGTGLGLAIVKAVAEAHGGTVGIRSTPGVGTIVSLRLPPHLVRAADAAQPNSQTRETQERKVEDAGAPRGG